MRQFPSQRLMAIIQLCFAFSLLLWYMVQPFMGEYFALRSRMLPYEYVMGTSELLMKQQNQKEKLERQKVRFQQLPDSQKEKILRDYQHLQSYAGRPAYQKILDGIKALTIGIPPFEQAWIFFSIVISILLLLHSQGARNAVWILPLIVLAYSADNQLTGKSLSSPDTVLFPTEEQLIRDYISEPLAWSPLEQKKQLENGWKSYLIDQWSITPDGSEAQKLEEGEFRFTLERIELLHGQARSDWLNVFHEKRNPLILLLFLTWNLFWAASIYAETTSKSLKTAIPAK